MPCFINFRREREPFTLALIILALINHFYVKQIYKPIRCEGIMPTFSGEVAPRPSRQLQHYGSSSNEITSTKTIYEPPHDKTNKVVCASSEDSDQPGHAPSLIRAFAVR